MTRGLEPEVLGSVPNGGKLSLQQCFASHDLTFNACDKSTVKSGFGKKNCVTTDVKKPGSTRCINEPFICCLQILLKSQ